MKIKKCLICGEAFAVGIYQARRLYCCDCAKVVKEIHQQEYRKSERRKSTTVSTGEKSTLPQAIPMYVKNVVSPRSSTEEEKETPGTASTA